MSSDKVIARIKGGLGNQLFCYAAARRCALKNDAELVLDTVTGFRRDNVYRRRYMLDRFPVPARKAKPSERLEPFERCRRGLKKWLSSRKPFEERDYISDESMDFDERLLSLRVQGTVYLDGYWQSEGYFKDVEETIRQDLRMQPPEDEDNQRIAEQIRGCESAAIHVRWFDMPGNSAKHNISADYYKQAVALMEEKAGSPHYFLFSDDAEAAEGKLNLPEGRFSVVSHNRGDDNACADLWLMSQCKHVIIANSTFSWWGGWLVQGDTKIVIAPSLKIDGIASWGFKGLIPDEWISI